MKLGALVESHAYYRWGEHSVSSSVMIVLIAPIIGISDAASLIAIFGVNASMILFGWVQEKYVKPGNYVRGEKAYIVLSLVAKSALAWQIFANTLIPPA